MVAQQAQSTKMLCIIFCLVITTSSFAHSKPIVFFSNKTFINKIEGESVVPVISNLRHVVAIAVDVKRRQIYFSETHDEDYEQVIKRASIDGSDITDIISKDVGICEGLAVEWRAKLLYWTDASNKWIQVASLDGSQRKVLFSGNLSEPRGIAVDPTSGYMFWTDWNASRIERADLDGHNRTVIVTEDIVWPNEIVVDINAKRVYWTDSRLARIDSSNYDGKNRRTLYEQQGLHPYGISLVNDLVYWTDWASRGLHTVNIRTGSVQSQRSYYDIGQPPMGVALYDSSLQPSGRSPCEKYNGYCRYLCLPNPNGYSCTCAEGQQVTNKYGCRIAHCPKLKSPLHGSMFACAFKSGNTCRFSCKTGGFRLRGSRIRTCLSNGTWTGSTVYCKDIQDPVIRCPKNIVTETQPGHSKAEVSWVVPNPTDNWEKPSLSTLFPYEGIHPPYSFPIGQNTISYKAEDKAKRTSYCFFTVTVKDKEPPKLVACPNDLSLVSDKKLATVVLPPVRFRDNNKVLRVDATVENGTEITWGTYDVIFTASDPSGNKAVCAFKLRIFSKKCKIDPPINGKTSCDSTSNGGMTCTIQCKKGFVVLNPGDDKYVCSSSGVWINVKYMKGVPKLPDCSRFFRPHKIKLDGQVSYQVDNCRNSQTVKGNEDLIIDDFKRNLQFCIGDKCTIENASMECRSPSDTKAKRRVTSDSLVVIFSVNMRLEPKDNLSALNAYAEKIISSIRENLNSGELDLIVGVQVLQADRREGLHVVHKGPVCCDGQMFRDGTCINCPPGYRYDKTNSTCRPCEPNTYQRREGQSKCNRCPGKTSTWRMDGAKSKTDCRECKDKGRQARLGLCESWLSSKGKYCNRDREIMYEFCPKSCGVCGPKSDTSITVADDTDYTTAATILVPVLVVIIILCAVMARCIYVRRRDRGRKCHQRSMTIQEMEEIEHLDCGDQDRITVSVEDLERKVATQSTQSQTDTDSSVFQMTTGRVGEGKHYKSADEAFLPSRRADIHSKFCESCEATLV